MKLYEYVLDRYMSILIERDVTLSLADALKNLVGSCKDSLDKVISYPIKVSSYTFFFISILMYYIKFKIIYLQCLYCRFMTPFMVPIRDLLLILLHPALFACMYFFCLLQ